MNNETEWIVAILFIYIITNGIAPFLMLGSDSIKNKRHFWLSVLVPFRVFFEGLFSFFKFLINNYKQFYSKLN